MIFILIHTLYIQGILFITQFFMLSLGCLIRLEGTWMGSEPCSFRMDLLAGQQSDRSSVAHLCIFFLHGARFLQMQPLPFMVQVDEDCTEQPSYHDPCCHLDGTLPSPTRVREESGSFLLITRCSHIRILPPTTINIIAGRQMY